MERFEPALRPIVQEDPAVADQTGIAKHGLQEISAASLALSALDAIASPAKVLLVGQATGPIAVALDERECSITGVIFDDAVVDEARVFCTTVGVTGRDALALPANSPVSGFDAVVFDSSLEQFFKPWRVLDGVRATLRDGGFVVAILPNVGHGAVKLALLKGSLPQTSFGSANYLNGFSDSSVSDLFVRAGYRVERIDSAHTPVFDGSDVPASLKRTDFPASVVEEIEADPYGTVSQFVVKALPLSPDAKERGIIKELHRANSDLTAAKLTIHRQQVENEAVRAAVDQSVYRIDVLERTVEALTSTASGTEDDAANQTLASAHSSATVLEPGFVDLVSRVRELEELHVSLRAQEADARAASSEHARHVAELQASIDATEAKLSTEIAIRSDIEKRHDTLSQRAAEYEALLAERASAALSANRELDELRGALETRTHAHRQSVADVDRLEHVVKHLQVDLDSARPTLAERDTEIALMHATMRAAVSARRNLERRAQNLALQRTCAEEKLGAIESQNAALQLQFAESEKTGSQLAESLSQLQTNFEQSRTELEDALTQQSSLSAELQATQATVARLDADLARRATDAQEFDRLLGIARETSSRHEREAKHAAQHARRSQEDALSEREASVAKLGDLEERLASTRSALIDNRKQTESIVAELSVRKVRVAQLEIDISSIEGRLSSSDAHVTELQAKLQACEREVVDTRAALNDSKSRLLAMESALEQADCDARERDRLLTEGSHYVAHLERELGEAKRWAGTEGARVLSLAIELENKESSFREHLRTLETDLEDAVNHRRIERDRAESAERSSGRLAQKVDRLERELEAVREASLSEKVLMDERLRDARERIREVETTVANGSRYAEHLEQEVANAQRWATDLDVELATVRSQTALELNAERERVAERDSRLAIEAVSRANLERRAKKLEGELGALEDSHRTLSENLSQTEARRGALSESLAHAENELVKQAEELVAEVQAESKQLATLIDTVQSSHFWKLKRWLRTCTLNVFRR